MKDDEKNDVPDLPPDQTLRLDGKAIIRFQEDLARIGSVLVIAGTSADVGRHVAIDEEVVIGRENTDLPLRDGRISRRHAAVLRSGQDHVVRDLGSTNGTRVNGQLIQGEQRLEDGDRIQVGATIIKFTLVDRTEAHYLSQMEKMVGTDELTGLLAKHRFDAALIEAIRLSHHTRRPLSALMMDLDGLKGINDAHGHHTGAATIRLVGELIARMLGERGDACRFGGDEFAAFLPGCDLPAAMEVAGKIRGEVEHTNFHPLEGIEVRVTISIGAVELPPHVHTIQALLHLADQALYRAKRRGRNCVSD
jgi:two-component system cell cycle response regulator